MAGGTWLYQNKVRPGVYINFESEPQAIGTLGERGIATMALLMSWGPSKEVIEIEAGENVKEKLGFNLADNELLLIRECLKRAKKLLLYRLNIGTKATATLDTMIVTAKYGGQRGNDLSVVVQANIDDQTKYDVRTFLDGTEVSSQTVSEISELESDWVIFSGTALKETAGLTLTGGTDGVVTNQDHTDYLNAIEVYEFNAIGLTSTDETLKSLYTSFTKRLREEEGYKIQLIVTNFPTADSEAVISVKNGVVLSDGTKLSPSQAVAWVTGATAGANVNESLTYQAYDDAVDVVPRYTNSQIIAALKNGEFVFTLNNGKVIVEQDINTLKSFTPKKSKQFSKNRVVRVLDEIGNGFKRIFDEFYIGKVDNNADGRNLLKNECNSFMGTLQGINAIQNFDSQNDVTVIKGNDSDSVYAEVYAQPVDSIEKIYMKVISA